MSYVDQGPGTRVVSRAVPFSDITSAEVKQLHDYLEELKGERPFAAKADLDPSRIKTLLPLLALMDISSPPLRVHYRLFGTYLVELYGDLTGTDLHLRQTDQRLIDDAYTNYQQLLTERRPIYGVTELEIDRDKTRTFEWAFFPLSADGTTITHVVYIEQRSAAVDRD
ncbi:MAG TPA: PAS domain-containing protein [Dongiaceae bacterium]|nr:PAS domain-containing protein [Dongiaceae bacterium]